jgi:hypothetical protein
MRKLFNTLHLPFFIYLLLLFLILSMTACTDSSANVKDSAPSLGKMYRQSLQHDGIEREYFIYLPLSYKKGNALPVVFSYMDIRLVLAVQPWNPPLGSTTMLNETISANESKFTSSFEYGDLGCRST